MIACLHLHSLDEALAGSLALIPSLAHRIETIVGSMPAIPCSTGYSKTVGLTSGHGAL